MTIDQKEKLLDLGVDLEETLERFVGNEDLYLRCLKKLSNDKNYSSMLDAIDSKDASAAFEAAHALKGVSANLGLDKLYFEMKIITEVFRAGSIDYDKDNLERLIAAYNHAIEVIDKL